MFANEEKPKNFSVFINLLILKIYSPEEIAKFAYRSDGYGTN